MVGIDSIIIMLIVGAVAGWLAGQIVRGFGFGLLWNIVIGIVGAFIGVWLLTQLGFVPFAGFVGSIVNATIGAVILLVIVGFIKRKGVDICGWRTGRTQAQTQEPEARATLYRRARALCRPTADVRSREAALLRWR